MPEAFDVYGQTWVQHHPEWDVRLWTDGDAGNVVAPSVLGQARHLAEQANVLRYELLRQFGGIYVDTDVECLRPIDPLIQRVEAFAGRVRAQAVRNAILRVVPHHPAFERAAQEVEQRVGAGLSSLEATAPKFLARLLADFPEVTIFDPEKFYPYHSWEKPRPGNAFPRSFAVTIARDAGARGVFRTTDRVDHLRRKVAKLERSRAGPSAGAAKPEAKEQGPRPAGYHAGRSAGRGRGQLWWRLRPHRILSGLRRHRGAPRQPT